MVDGKFEECPKCAGLGKFVYSDDDHCGDYYYYCCQDLDIEGFCCRNPYIARERDLPCELCFGKRYVTIEAAFLYKLTK